MKVLHIANADAAGGAARGAYLVHRALLDAGLTSRMLVARKFTDDETVFGPSSMGRVIRSEARRISALQISRLLGRNRSAELRSVNMLPSHLARLITSFGPDVVHLHWIGLETLSLGDVLRLSFPIVWTIRDMWPFVGVAHYLDIEEFSRRYVVESAEVPIGIDRMILARKRRIWHRPDVIPVGLSSWIARLAERSKALDGKEASVVGNPADPEAFRPMRNDCSRSILGLPPDKTVLLFGALSPMTDTRKGADLVLAALGDLSSQVKSNLLLCIFGNKKPVPPDVSGVPVVGLGYLPDDRLLSLAYSAASVTLVPSRLEAFGKTALESLLCGTPVVAFQDTGVADIVTHGLSGILSKEQNHASLARAIEDALDLASDGSTAEACRTDALEKFAPKKIVASYREVYGSAVAREEH